MFDFAFVDLLPTSQEVIKCGDCPWCIVHFSGIDTTGNLSYHDGFRCSYVNPQIVVKLSDFCHHGYSSFPTK